ncbi:MAG: hypothetical protein KF809_12970 [Chloroflexi bacterium]|nr:hypothetical protein [Chloroflexota bacterium]
MTSLGFRRDRRTGRASWRRTEEGVETDLVVVPSAHDFFQGRGRFTIEVSEWDPVSGRVTNERLAVLLDDDQRERLRALIDEVRRRMPRPDPDLLDELTEDERRWYLSGFDPVRAPFLLSEDVWFEYVDEQDAAAAFTFVGEVLPTCLGILTRVGIEEHARRSAAGADDDGSRHLLWGLDAVLGSGSRDPHDAPRPVRSADDR